MSAVPSTEPLTLTARIAQMFPTLTAAQIARVGDRGHRRPFRLGEVLVAAGTEAAPFFLVTAGRLEIVRTCGGTETLVAVQGPGEFTGEMQMLSGRRSLVAIRAAAAGEAIELGHEQLLALVQTDSELSDILMRAFILRRVELIAHGFGDVVVIGSEHCRETLRVKGFLTRNGHPYAYLDLDRDAEVQDLLDRFRVTASDVPVLICRGDRVLRNPTNRQIAECLGLNAQVDATQTRDLVIVGAGPAGLAAAVYAGSEGLDVLAIETSAPGGQAGSSSKIENYLGFPTGISGQALAARAYTQAQKFGVQTLIARSATRLLCDRRPYAVEIGGGDRVPARSIVIASGAEYRRPALEHLARFEGAGIYYGATFMEAQLCAGEEAIVVGGGNSAGQAAVFLAQTARRVHVLVRGGDLAASMSRYLVRRLEGTPAIALYTDTELVALEGDTHLEGVRWRDRTTGAVAAHPVRHVFMMTGAAPNTAWLDGRVARDPKGFVKTGTDLTQDDLDAARWAPGRPPHLLETSVPGVFAVGDVRSGSVKRVASAVGEGSVSVAFVHQILHE
jgi:thioredoxin reductase (NADPH)